MPHVNLIAVLLCGVGSMALAAIWYAPPVFGRAWQRLAGVSEADIAAGSMAIIYGLAFLLSLVAAYVFGLFLGPDMGVAAGTAAGAAAGLCWVAAAFGINYLFERRPFRLWLINGGYHFVQFTMFGAVLAGFR